MDLIIISVTLAAVLLTDLAILMDIARCLD
jgi:hypothetical protein